MLDEVLAAEPGDGVVGERRRLSFAPSVQVAVTGFENTMLRTLSVVIPSCNMARGFGHSIRFLAAQVLPDHEHVATCTPW